MADSKTYERFTMFDNWGAMFDEMSDEDAIKLFRAMYRYAFEGEEPEFEKGSMLSLVWRSVKPNIDASGKAAKGGSTSRPKKPENGSETPSATTSGTPSETHSATTSGTKGKGKGIGREGEREEKGDGFSPEGKNHPPDTDGAGAWNAPPVSVKCPTCGTGMEPMNMFESGTKKRIYRCPLCATEKAVDERGAA